MYRILNNETGQVYYEADTLNELANWYHPIYKATGITAEGAGERGFNDFAFVRYTPELLRILGHCTMQPVMDVVAGLILATLAIILMMGLGGVFG